MPDRTTNVLPFTSPLRRLEREMEELELHEARGRAEAAKLDPIPCPTWCAGGNHPYDAWDNHRGGWEFTRNHDAVTIVDLVKRWGGLADNPEVIARLQANRPWIHIYQDETRVGDDDAAYGNAVVSFFAHEDELTAGQLRALAAALTAAADQLSVINGEMMAPVRRLAIAQ